MSTWHLHIQGQVQGVGFRPNVYRLAYEQGLSGWVNNGKDGVHMEFNATLGQANSLKRKIENAPPAMAIITSIRLEEVPEKDYTNFSIIESEENGKANLLLPPDFALCADCRKELLNTSNRRFAYPFTTCTHCGPRFSIITRLPYDRQNTTMDTFEMCSTCSEEYQDPRDRRYYSQTNSCPECRIKMTLYNSAGDLMESDDKRIIAMVVQAWQQGKIVAIKGIGGYLLTGAADHIRAIQTLRERKHRPSKPFALMYPGVADLRRFDLSEKIIDLLESPAAPIVLLDKKSDLPADEEIAPGLNQFGVMLPYTPLYELLLQKFGKAIVATSGNISNATIVYTDEKALRELGFIADLILTNNRKIVLPQDDSVFQFSTFSKQRILLRRSRGLAPTYLNPRLEWKTDKLFASGAMLKSTFALLKQGKVYLSPYLGDLEHFDSQQSYEQSVDHFMDVLDADIETLICDKHPDYPSTQFATNWSQEKGILLYKVQHHIAHFGAILGEHDLLHSKDAVLGVIWDGTGFGEDGHIWGGEFFKYENYRFERIAHLSYYPAILGDKMPKEPRISALSATWGIEEAKPVLAAGFSDTEYRIYNNLLSKPQRLQTSSMGRLFDALAALLGIMDKQSYEGEAAIRLEALATNYCKTQGLDFTDAYAIGITENGEVSVRALLESVIADIHAKVSIGKIAAKFHYSLVCVLRQIVEKYSIQKIACSGGVFQNALLVDMIIHHLGKDYDLYFHEQLAPNDENIAFGQLICYAIDQFRIQAAKSKTHVFSHTR